MKTLHYNDPDTEDAILRPVNSDDDDESCCRRCNIRSGNVKFCLKMLCIIPVSYTHLTLPTNREV